MGGISLGSPGTIVAVELAFARRAREKGQWAAFREYADKGAVMFVPLPVGAQDWLKGREDPPAPVQWQTHSVWVSCDGTLAATRGAWQKPDGTVGYFTTIWKRGKKDDYRWVLDQGDTLATPLPAPEMLAGQIADCAIGRGPGGPGGPGGFGPDGDMGPGKGPRAPREATAAPVGMEGTGRSADGTLEYSYRVAPDMGRTLTVRIRKDGQMREAMTSTVAAPAQTSPAGS